MTDGTRYGEADRLHWEVKKCEAEARKLEAENADLRRHPMAKSSFWFAAIPAVVAVVGVGLQYYASSLDYKKADILREQAEFKIAQAKQQLDDLDTAVKTKQARLDELTRVTAELDAARAAKDTEVKTLTQLVANLRDEKLDRKQQLAKLDESLASLKAQQRRVEDLAKEQFRIVGNLVRPKS